MKTLDWSSVIIDENDLDLIYNCLLEKETPMTPVQLAETVIENRIKISCRRYSRSEKYTVYFVTISAKYTVYF